jgi:hypothetical protein
MYLVTERESNLQSQLRLVNGKEVREAQPRLMGFGGLMVSITSAEISAWHCIPFLQRRKEVL